MSYELRNPIAVSVRTSPLAEDKNVATMLKRTGQNTGNLLFSKSTCELFDNGSSIPFGAFSTDVLKSDRFADHDCIVLAAANWLNQGADLGWLCDTLEAVDLPVIVLGLGAQSTMDKRIPKIKPGTARLVSLLAERSPLISARGPFSCEVLEHYGAKNAVATGCPSFLLNRGQVPTFETARFQERLNAQDIVIHGTRHHFNQTDAFNNYLYRQAYMNRHDLLLQSELADFYYTLGRSDDEETMQKAVACLEQVYGVAPTEIKSYLEAHGRVFFRMEDWFDYCRTKKFFLGTRIHGTIAAILSGTPALLIAHDSRTVELAETMGVPFILKDEVDTDRPLQMDRYYQRALEHNFEESYRRYWTNFTTFFNDCRLKTNLHEAST